MMLLTIFGCKSKESIAWEKKLKAETEASNLAWEKFDAQIYNLPSCEGAKWFDYCDPDLYLPDYRTVQVHIHSANKDAQSYMRPAVKRSLEKRGYSVWVGRDISEKEYTAVDDSFNDDYMLPPTVKPGAKRCKIQNPDYIEGTNRIKFYEVRYNIPLIDELLLTNPNSADVDAVLFVKTIFLKDGSKQYWRVDSQLYDIKAEKITLWNRVCYRSGCGEGIKAFMKTKTGAPSSKIVGNKVYTSTPYWFEGNKQGLLSQALDEMFEHLPKRVDNKMELRTLPEKYNGICPTWKKIIMVFE